MKVQGISLNVVRNKYEYEKYVSPEYRAKYSYEDSKASLPWLVIGFNKDSAATENNTAVLNFSPAADFTACGTDFETNGYAVDSADKSKLKLDLSRDFSRFMLNAKAECSFSEIPARLEATIANPDGSEVKALRNAPDLSKPDSVLENLDKRCLESGEGYLAQVLYELIVNQSTEDSKNESDENEPEGN